MLSIQKDSAAANASGFGDEVVVPAAFKTKDEHSLQTVEFRFVPSQIVMDRYLLGPGFSGVRVSIEMDRSQSAQSGQAKFSAARPPQHMKGLVGWDVRWKVSETTWNNRQFDLFWTKALGGFLFNGGREFDLPNLVLVPDVQEDGARGEALGSFWNRFFSDLIYGLECAFKLSHSKAPIIVVIPLKNEALIQVASQSLRARLNGTAHKVEDAPEDFATIKSLGESGLWVLPDLDEPISIGGSARHDDPRLWLKNAIKAWDGLFDVLGGGSVQQELAPQEIDRVGVTRALRALSPANLRVATKNMNALKDRVIFGRLVSGQDPLSEVYRLLQRLLEASKHFKTCEDELL